MLSPTQMNFLECNGGSIGVISIRTLRMLLLLQQLMNLATHTRVVRHHATQILTLPFHHSEHLTKLLNSR